MTTEASWVLTGTGGHPEMGSVIISDNGSALIGNTGIQVLDHSTRSAHGADYESYCSYLRTNGSEWGLVAATTEIDDSKKPRSSYSFVKGDEMIDITLWNI